MMDWLSGNETSAKRPGLLATDGSGSAAICLSQTHLPLLVIQTATVGGVWLGLSKRAPPPMQPRKGEKNKHSIAARSHPRNET